MHTLLTDRELLANLHQDAEVGFQRHVEQSVDWQPHDFVPWDAGRSFAFLGGQDWEPEQSTLSRTAATALTVSVLLADNLPAYHRNLAKCLRRGVWWRWVGRWTAEEARHSVVLRNYLMVTRAVDPVELERIRMAHMTAGFRRQPQHLLEVLVTGALEETAAAVRHRATAALGENDLVTAITTRLAQDDDNQARFYIDLVTAALKLAPEQTREAIAACVADFTIPEFDLPSGTTSTEALAAAGLYDPALQEEKVFTPLLAHWQVARPALQK